MKLRSDGLYTGIWTYLGCDGLIAQWYWPENVHGKIWNFVHLKGWRVIL
jgi:hypothetical protein